MIKNKKTFLITGAAGFIGSEIAKRLIINGENVIGIDNLNSYYDVNLKKSRLFEIEECNNKFSGKWFFHQISIENRDQLEKICEEYSFDVVIHLAAQAGVRFSITNPEDYVKANLVGFFNILELCRENKINNFIFASSSSVYGGNKKVPFKESHNVDHPVSFYAATKKSNEVMAHSYSHLFNIPTTGLRFFTVYGPWGRPDMAPMIFAKSILKKETINIFNYGDMIRDFTYIDDVTETIYRCCYKPATKLEDSIREEMPFSSSLAPYRVFNVGNNNPVKLINFINLLENYLGCKAFKNFEEMKQGDVQITYSDSSRIKDWINFAPQTKIEDGVGKFANWFKSFYGIN
tara:strand:+ start:67 stop:1107 length:1041 start_codon:yes stop_codon:yes gene_type:complete